MVRRAHHERWLEEGSVHGSLRQAQDRLGLTTNGGGEPFMVRQAYHERWLEEGSVHGSTGSPRTEFFLSAR